MITRSNVERRLRSLEQATRPQGRSFVIHCRDGEEDSERGRGLIAKIEREYGAIHPARDQLVVIREFGETSVVSDDIIVHPLIR